MIDFKKLLLEGRRDDLLKKYQNEFVDKTIVKDFLDAPFNKRTNYKYADWMLKNGLDYYTPSLDDLNLSDLHYMVDFFDKNKAKMKYTDLNQYEGIPELLEDIQEVETNKKTPPEYEKVYEDDKLLIVNPKNFTASCKYGAGTRWCTTSSEDHFRRYTSDGKALYYIIMKGLDRSNLFYKVAIVKIPFSEAEWWDSIDDRMTEREIKAYLSFAKSAYDAVIRHYQENYLTENFYRNLFAENESGKIRQNYIDRVTKIVYNNIQLIDRSNFSLDVFLYYNDKEIQHNIIFGKMNIEDGTFTFSVKSEPANPNSVDYGLNFENFRKTITFVPQKNFGEILTYELDKKLSQVTINENFQKLRETNPTWFPRTGGYTFQKNKGLINSLVNWLDEVGSGTKLEFLVWTKKFEIVNAGHGKFYFFKKGSSTPYSPNSLRGQYSTFFSAAKRARIIDYERVGKKILIKKGKNFEAFKEGKLKAQ